MISNWIQRQNKYFIAFTESSLDEFYDSSTDYYDDDSTDDSTDVSLDIENALEQLTPDTDGNFLVDDMILTQDQFNFEFGGPIADDIRDSGRRRKKYRWKKRIVYYDFSPEFSEFYPCHA